MKPVSVSQLNNYIKRILQTDPILGNVSVTGEISNLKFHGSGHVYFSLKDENSRVSCFLAYSSASKLTFVPEEGMDVTAEGYISLYERGGSYSLNVRYMEENGRGELAAEFERLKKKLQERGIFDSAHKKPIPPFPEKIAVVTSDTGAAVRDIVKIITSKNDCVDILICPVLVQGPDAARDISSMIDRINREHPEIDTMIVGRGGGSAEELWAFNEEEVALSIYRSEIPVISAVGHETDFTIADFAADMRAETPTAAADAAVYDSAEIKEKLSNMKEDLANSLKNILERKSRALESTDMRILGRDLASRAAMDRMRIDHIFASMQKDITAMTAALRNRLSVIHERMAGADPEAVLSRGYSIVRDDEGRIIRDMTTLSAGDSISVEGARGIADAEIKGTKERCTDG